MKGGKRQRMGCGGAMGRSGGSGEKWGQRRGMEENGKLSEQWEAARGARLTPLCSPPSPGAQGHCCGTVWGTHCPVPGMGSPGGLGGPSASLCCAVPLGAVPCPCVPPSWLCCLPAVGHGRGQCVGRTAPELSPVPPPRRAPTVIAVLVVGGLFLSCSCVLLSLLYWRGKKIQKKRAMRRYLERGEVSGGSGGQGVPPPSIPSCTHLCPLPHPSPSILIPARFCSVFPHPPFLCPHLCPHSPCRAWSRWTPVRRPTRCWLASSRRRS